MIEPYLWMGVQPLRPVVKRVDVVAFPESDIYGPLLWSSSTAAVYGNRGQYACYEGLLLVLVTRDHERLKGFIVRQLSATAGLLL